MLSRTANGLFWIGRYVERADTVCRMVEAARQDYLFGSSTGPDALALTSAYLDSSADPQHNPAENWQELLDLHMCDESNLSSMKMCFAAARDNAREQRVYLTSEIWLATNTAWQETRDLSIEQLGNHALNDVLGRGRRLAAWIQGSVEGTLLRNAGYAFIKLGQMIERCDGTARLLKGAAPLLAGHTSDQELALSNLLKGLGILSAFRTMYSGTIEAKHIIDILVLNPMTPRSINFCLKQIVQSLSEVYDQYGLGAQCRGLAAEMLDDLACPGAEMAELISGGVDHHAAMLIDATFQLGQNIEDEFGLKSMTS